MEGFIDCCSTWHREWMRMYIIEFNNKKEDLGGTRGQDPSFQQA